MTRTGKLRAVAIGAGYFSRFHLEAWGRISDVELLGVCDVERAKAEQAAADFQIPQVGTSAAEMLDDVRPDFVDIITRPETHLGLVKLAAERGIHVICQKPLAPSLAAAEQIVDLAADAGIRLMVHENFRFQPWHRQVKALLESGEIGSMLHSISCRTRLGDGWQPDAYRDRQPYFAEMPRLLVYETGVHFVDTFRYLGGEIDGVFADLRKLNAAIAGEDTGIVHFEFASGARGLWDASRYHEPATGDPRYTFGEFLLEGSEGAIRLDGDGRITVKRLGQAEREYAYEHSRRNFAGDCVYFTQRHFAEALREGTLFETEGKHYLANVRVQDAIYQSAESELPVRGLLSGDDDDAHR